MLKSDGGCLLVSWSEGIGSDGLVADDDGLLADVGNHGRCDYKHTDGVRHK